MRSDRLDRAVLQMALAHRMRKLPSMSGMATCARKKLAVKVRAFDPAGRRPEAPGWSQRVRAKCILWPAIDTSQPFAVCRSSLTSARCRISRPRARCFAIVFMPGAPTPAPYPQRSTARSNQPLPFLQEWTKRRIYPSHTARRDRIAARCRCAALPNAPQAATKEEEGWLIPAWANRRAPDNPAIPAPIIQYL